jgi:hypothetical protein
MREESSDEKAIKHLQDAILIAVPTNPHSAKAAENIYKILNDRNVSASKIVDFPKDKLVEIFENNSVGKMRNASDLYAALSKAILEHHPTSSPLPVKAQQSPVAAFGTSEMDRTKAKKHLREVISKVELGKNLTFSPEKLSEIVDKFYLELRNTDGRSAVEIADLDENWIKTLYANRRDRLVNVGSMPSKPIIVEKSNSDTTKKEEASSRQIQQDLPGDYLDYKKRLDESVKNTGAYIQHYKGRLEGEPSKNLQKGYQKEIDKQDAKLQKMLPRQMLFNFLEVALKDNPANVSFQRDVRKFMAVYQKEHEHLGRFLDIYQKYILGAPDPSKKITILDKETKGVLERINIFAVDEVFHSSPLFGGIHFAQSLIKQGVAKIRAGETGLQDLRKSNKEMLDEHSKSGKGKEEEKKSSEVGKGESPSRSDSSSKQSGDQKSSADSSSSERSSFKKN